MNDTTARDIADMEVNVKKDCADDHQGGLEYSIGWLKSMVVRRDAKIARLETEIERLKKLNDDIQFRLDGLST